MIPESYTQAKKKFLEGDFSVAEFFKTNGYLLEYAYCQLLQGEADKALTVFRKISKEDMRGDWGRKLIQFIQGYVTNVPTYFQIRNFLEIDLNLLLNARQAQFVENIINGADLFYSINPESYKFIARVMLQNDFPEVGQYYLEKAKMKFYQDPELHYLLANCHLKQGNTAEAKLSLFNCLKILPQYYPARKLLEKIN